MSPWSPVKLVIKIEIDIFIITQLTCRVTWLYKNIWKEFTYIYIYFFKFIYFTQPNIWAYRPSHQRGQLLAWLWARTQETHQRHMGHLDFHTSSHSCVIDSDRQWVTASTQSLNTQVDNDSSIISVTGTHCRPRCVAIIL